MDIKDLFERLRQDGDNQEPKVYSGEPEREKGPKRAKQAAEKAAKTSKRVVTLLVIIAIIVFLLTNTFYTVREGEYAYITQFGRIVTTVEKPGLKVKIPFLQDVNRLEKKLLVYDVSPSEVLTADKKAMIVDSYALWHITEVTGFIRSVGSISEFERRLDASCYSVIKNVMGQLQQTQLISDEESNRDSLNDRVTELVKENLKGYGVAVERVEIRRYDLPPDNLSAVYDRMISERGQMAAQYKAEGEYEASKIRNSSDKEYEVIIADAKADADRIRGNAEAAYIETLGEIYQNKDQEQFYKLLLELEALEESLQGGNKTIILSEDSVLADFLDAEWYSDEP